MKLYTCQEKLPEIGERVKVVCVKEMIYKGSEENSSALWEDDGEGERFVIMWGTINQEVK